MLSKHLIVGLVLSLGLSACSGTDPATRNIPPSAQVPVRSAIVPHSVASRYTVTAVNVTVPQKLRVSEANMYLPIADIVWRGEPRGERHEQVKAIFEDAMATGTRAMRSGPAVVVDIEVTRFHALTEKTRYTVGGIHSLRFVLTVRDAATGRILDGPRRVVADVKGSGGAQAIADDARGRTQRVVIVERLSQVIARELTEVAPAPVATRGDSDLQLGLGAIAR